MTTISSDRQIKLAIRRFPITYNQTKEGIVHIAIGDFGVYSKTFNNVASKTMEQLLRVQCEENQTNKPIGRSTLNELGIASYQVAIAYTINRGIINTVGMDGRDIYKANILGYMYNSGHFVDIMTFIKK